MDRSFKGNFQGILNGILQTLRYYCWEQDKNIENSQIFEQNVVISLCLSLCLLRLVLPLPSWAAECFQFLDTVLREIKRHNWSLVKCIVSFSGLKMVFSKLSLAKYHFLYKKPVFTVTWIYFISCLQLSAET